MAAGAARVMTAGSICAAFWVGLLYGRGLAPTELSSPRYVAPVHLPFTPLSEEKIPFILLGVITNPSGFKRRKMLREFSLLSGGAKGGVRTEYVIGQGYVGEAPPAALQQKVAAEVSEHGDIVFVDGRENLPNVGKATEKSAAWWLSAPRRSAASVFCKTDDDSLIHLGHLSATLQAAVQQLASEHFLYSFVRWRGWLPLHRLQACGGGWGGPGDAISQMEDPANHCELAEGPFPQGTGTLTCMSAALAKRLASEEEFDTFLRVAKARNDFGALCRTANECAAHSPGETSHVRILAAPSMSTVGASQPWRGFNNG